MSVRCAEAAAVAATVAMQANAPAAIVLRQIITGCLCELPTEAVIALAIVRAMHFRKIFVTLRER